MSQFSLRRPGGMLALVGGFVGLAVLLAAQAPAPPVKNINELIPKIVVQAIEEEHLAHPKINGGLAKEWCRHYIETLDPQKVYFLKKDVDDFLAASAPIVDQAKRGDVSFAHRVFQKFLERHKQAYETQLEMLKKTYDFHVDESIADDPKTFDYPADEKEYRDRWRKRVKLDLLREKVDKVEPKEAIDKLTRRYRERNKFWNQMDSSDVLEIYLTSLTTIIDPHTNYMSARTWEDFMQTLRLELEGIGASLASEDGYAVVKEIIPGAPADKDGRLKPEDKIIGVKNDKGEVTDLVERRLGDVVRYIRGPRGTVVRLVVEKAKTKEHVVYELTRDKVELKDSHAKSQIVETKGDDGKPLKIGVIDLPSFYADTEAIRRGDDKATSATQDCRDILDDFKKKGVDAVLIDLRRNGGGLLREAISLSGLFIDEGPVVQVRDGNRVRPLDDDEEGTAWDGPLVVLISRQSASASEIFAGVIKDYKRGLILGDSSTFGKGTVQSVLELNERLPRDERFRLRGNPPQMGALKLTIQQFYRANGESTQLHGVRPDIHLPSILDHIDALSEGKMEHALRFDKVPPQPHDLYNKVSTDLVARLADRSEDRRKSSEKFKKLEERIKKYVESKAHHAVPLDEDKYRAEVLDIDEDDPENLDSGDEPDPGKKKKNKGRTKRFVDRPAWESNYYNDEVINIVRDYLTLGSKVLASVPLKSQR